MAFVSRVLAGLGGGRTAHNALPEPALPAWLTENFDPDWYLRTYPDVAAAGVDPLEHWLLHGAKEGRAAAPNLVVDAIALRPGESPGNELLAIDGTCYRARLLLPTGVLAQIIDQGRYDPAVLAPGPGVLALLPRESFAHGLDYAKLFDAIPRSVSYLFVVEKVQIGGAEKFAADMVQALLELEQTDVAVIVTGHTSAEAERNRELETMAPLRRVRTLFWPDLFGDDAGASNGTLFARALNALRPKRVIVANSRIGMEAIAVGGRALSTVSRLYCTHFVFPEEVPGAFLEPRYARMTVRFTKNLTDNQPLAQHLAERYGPLGGPGTVVVPNRLEQAGDEVFERRLAARQARCGQPSLKRQWLWISRINNFHKGAGVVATLARRLPNDEFHLFGPLEFPLDSMGLNLPNVRHGGILTSVLGSDFTAYDGYLLTSEFEGLPNIVLEMSQHALPLVLSRVGGLPETFSDDSVEFVDPAASPAARMDAFCNALQRVAGYSAADVERRARRARAEVAARHDKHVFRRNIAAVLEVQ